MNITQNCQKIELYGSPTTKDLKKPYSSRWVGGVSPYFSEPLHVSVPLHSRDEWRGTETWSGSERYGDKEGAVQHPHVVDKFWEGYLSSKTSQPQPDHQV